MENINSDYDYMEIVWQIRQNIPSNPSGRVSKYLLKVFRFDLYKFRKKLLKPHKETLLHRLIRVECEVVFRAFLPNLQDLSGFLKPYLDKHLTDQELMARLGEWSKRYEQNPEKAELYPKDLLLASMLPLSDFVDKIIFPILFSDRLFLFRFNLLLSDLTASLNEELTSEIMNKNGYIKRQDPPKWLREGIKRRDKKLCVECEKYLGSEKVEEGGQLDHIIPLAKHGTNDPTNYQLLCEKCNQEKGTKEIRPPQPKTIYWQ